MRRRTLLVLVRHAAVDCTRNGDALLCGRYDAPLSAAGREQVSLLRQRLAVETPFDASYSSPLRRAIETAEAAPADLFASSRRLRSLTEISCGDLDGLPIETVQREYPELWALNEAQSRDDFTWPGGESYRRFRIRILRAIHAISRAHASQRVLLFTHAGVINQILGTIAGQSSAEWKNYRPRTASITRVSWHDDEGVLETFDDCAHLETDQLVKH